MIQIKPYSYNHFCEMGDKNKAKFSVGHENTHARLRQNICEQCLKEIISQGLEAISEEDRDSILDKYIEEVDEPQEAEQEIPQEPQEPQQQEIKQVSKPITNNKNGGNKK